MKLKIKKVHPSAVVPRYASEGAACFDLHAIEDANLLPYRPVELRTGLAFEVPEGFALLVYSRSGHGFKHGVRLANCVGVVDSDFRGELRLKLRIDRPSAFDISCGDRVAQAMLVAVPKVEFELVEQLSETDRGANGFGSTGVQ